MPTGKSMFSGSLSYRRVCNGIWFVILQGYPLLRGRSRRSILSNHINWQRDQPLSFLPGDKNPPRQVSVSASCLGAAYQLLGGLLLFLPLIRKCKKAVYCFQKTALSKYTLLFLLHFNFECHFLP